MGAPSRDGLSSATEPLSVSALRASIPSAPPTLDERNEDFIPPRFDMQGGKLGETPILWKFRMAYPWSEQFAEEMPEWDQCCTCWVFAVSEAEARRSVWEKFTDSFSVMPEAIASCHPERFRNGHDDEIDARLASAIEARSGETHCGSTEGESAPEGDAR